MNEDTISGKWHEISGRVREAWADLTDADLEKIKGSWQEASGYLQNKYGETKDAVEEKINELLND